ncbi:MAG: Abi family protein [Deltaproteobacteria bacterium]|nr:Abi family protein [Deltaproteobacteria bacterium]
MSEIYQRYEKPVLNIDQQLELLINQGLIVKNPKRILHYLCFIGYHRLSGYFRTFQLQNISEYIFKKGTAFDSIISLYIFDRKLRLLVMDAVERIEVAAANQRR